MTVRRWLSALALGILAVSTGCQAWCSRHYPCPAAYPAAAPVACVPCCPPGASGYPATAPIAAPASPWGAPAARATVPCVPCQ